MSEPKIKCILFDWDGTLQRVSWIKHRGYAILGIFLPAWLKQFVFECIEFVDSFLAQPSLIISETCLRKIKERYRIGIATNRSKMFMETILKRAELGEGFFDVIAATRGLWNTWHERTRGWVLINPKPSLFLTHFSFRSFLRRNKINLFEVLFMGDDVSDYLSTKGTQVHFAGIAPNEARKRDFLSAGLSEELIFSTPQDALRHFGIVVE